MNRRLHAALLTAVAVVGVIVLGWMKFARADMSDISVVTGSVYAMSISVCSKKQSAIDVLDATKISRDHGNKLFDALDDCDNIAAAFRVGPVVYEAKFPDGTSARVVEIQVPTNAKLKAYWMTSMKVVASVAKPGEKPSNEIRQPVQIKPS